MEEFKNKFSDFGVLNSCKIVNKFYKELNQGLQTFDIEMIKTKLSEFPDVISDLKAMALNRKK